VCCAAVGPFTVPSAGSRLVARKLACHPTEPTISPLSAFVAERMDENHGAADPQVTKTCFAAEDRANFCTFTPAGPSDRSQYESKWEISV
jgi:hypothetical protein